MKLKTRDMLSTLVILLVAVPYVGYLVNGEMPFIKDPRGMSAVGLILGTVAYFVLISGEEPLEPGTTAVASVTGALGVLALVLAETAAAEVLLAVFMGSILLAWAIILMDHAGVLPFGHHSTGRA